MSPDEFQEAWQAESERTRITIDTSLLLREVQRSQHDFRATILLRDYREAGVAILMIPLWFFLGYLTSPVWTWYLTVPALIWVSGFIIVDRLRRPQRLSGPEDSLRSSVQESLRQVEHQIGLLRNIFWWYLLPFTIPIVIFFAHTSYVSADGNWFVALGLIVMPSAFVLALYGFIYYLNQYAVRKQLEPRRRELLTLLASLEDESLSGAYPILTNNAKGIACSPRRAIFAAVCFVAILFIGVPLILLGAPQFSTRFNAEFPKTAPFDALRWDDVQPEVRIGGEWYTLVSLDQIPAEDIVAHCQATYGDRWRMRFGEDLVEVLAGMGHEPKSTVRLVVTPLGSDVPQSLEAAAMTEANRTAVRDARIAAEMQDVSLPNLVADLRAENELVGLAAMIAVAGEVVESAADGERKLGSGVAVTADDRWHVGSITKSVTATMIARLVESGAMEWDDTVGAYFAESIVHDDWKPVTLRQLLTHNAGAPDNFPISVRRKRPPLGPECTQARREAVLDVLSAKPESRPGTRFAYSNVGYTIAGAMAEQAAGAAWEDLVEREVFEPMGLTGAGFGPPKSPDATLDQPRGHLRVLLRKTAVADDADNTPIVGPAGTVHMTLADLCVYATEHLRGERGAGKLLAAETYTYLHAPERDDYACGWVVRKPGAGIPHTVYWHNGSNTMWYALVVFIPDLDMTVAVAANDGDIAKAEAAAWEIVQAAAARHATSSPREG